ncbi:hypothetical protein EC912_10813 [Luteibacter rhizovicinus]|uniref:Uncharacterized protein n=2 Tax=Luteibacter rhizovicinus TaxID=242606 RepID=A0A4R3YIZ2_9GAMM|nr:hypothetical protein EC912_10813 [Luteibacter rhizovicinus]
MKPWPRFVLFASVLPFTATAAPPPPGDFLKVLLHERISVEGAHLAVALSDDDYIRAWMIDPVSPYSGIKEGSRYTPGAAVLQAIASVSVPGHPMSVEGAIDAALWDYGSTKARLNDDIPLSALPSRFTNVFAGASAVKAGIEPDIFFKALALTGEENHIVAANYAVAVQTLKELLDGAPAERHFALGLRKDILTRFLDTNGPQDLPDYDRFYLMRLLDGEMSRWKAGGLSAYGIRELPAVLRVARAAAAFRDLAPYDNGQPCNADGTFRSYIAGGGGADLRPLCHVDATDRAVYAWYVRDYREQIVSREPKGDSSTLFIDRMIGPMLNMRQGRLGSLSPHMSGFTSRVEVFEAKMAKQLLAEGKIAALDAEVVSDRALRLTCGRI